jgi:hypothetical protein
VQGIIVVPPASRFHALASPSHSIAILRYYGANAVGGDGKVAEVDSGYFGGYVRPANLAQHRVDRRFGEHQSGKRKAVIVIRERDGSPCGVCAIIPRF